MELKNKMKITKTQLRKIIREAIKDEPIRQVPGDSFSSKSSKRPYGSYSKKSGSSYSDTITMSPNGDSVLVDGMETYITDVPQQLEIVSGFDMSDEEGDNLIDALDKQMDSGYVELSVEFKNGKWSF